MTGWQERRSLSADEWQVHVQAVKESRLSRARSAGSMARPVVLLATGATSSLTLPYLMQRWCRFLSRPCSRSAGGRRIQA